ncbi:unnamed protein product [Bursaphelenchus okinawaensis]|uniref:Glutaredoxin-2, mitochondrial n=1 Tax=Bursaphelenchus okinawaensis TaxID=465554 RepID=A0A811JSG4_9BILA|nr:unnamed protein product [Bursaphelenchus okinawaensis]CAG9080844.1 unnamed protein product [Bursaphelenchus okinawaensis]
MSVKAFVDGLISSKKVVIFSKTYCPFCTKAKDAIGSFKLQSDAIETVELDKRNDCDQVQDYLKDITGGRSVPRVFINGKFLGGGDDTVAALKNGSLESKLKEAGAL